MLVLEDFVDLVVFEVPPDQRLDDLLPELGLLREDQAASVSLLFALEVLDAFDDPVVFSLLGQVPLDPQPVLVDFYLAVVDLVQQLASVAHCAFLSVEQNPVH